MEEYEPLKCSQNGRIPTAKMFSMEEYVIEKKS
jgi:hypothetical protein